ncbi:PREDICTED: O-glucosyltransferase rumi homolog [Nelumbo nucifera]|uniref:Glycosyl transferase CAP10 domain-containing protein n=2 Tax=Nelumbo nucifera TaxID=4432 RepID=A0A822XEX1_NELNU|nr:PREDICTED: O-glucosyltransferase rumi homolog [Nelumbo nucifera]DAD18880.1 TPA_asm: hypothetical protein HUJ06_020343 [Nelumbo nucifera]
MQRLLRTFRKISGVFHQQYSSTVYRPLKKGPSTTTLIFLFFVLFIGAFISARWIDASSGAGGSTLKALVAFTPSRNRLDEIPLNCSAANITQTCSVGYGEKFEQSSSTEVCPEYFRWIHEDLRVWKETGISKEMVEGAKRSAFFRLTIVNGTAYTEKYRNIVEGRDVFTLWGILQLMRRYPGRLPDLDLMFNVGDKPVIRSRPKDGAPPPLFHYCGDNWSFDIVFPDWSFWGWPEINIKPWEPLLKDLKEGNERTKWVEREPYAYWKGNPAMSKGRRELVNCNVSDKQDWNGRIYKQDWIRESQQGYKQSNLANQCTHRYKIYIEGIAWSVSQKYILACDSVTLIIKPQYYDFFTRNLVPLHHYWPMRDEDKCRSMKFAVDWGNNHTQEAQAIGKAASDFIQEELKMDYVYDYVFHLLNEYAKLLTYKPVVPPNAVELCPEIMACSADGLKKKFMMESMVKSPAVRGPCTLTPSDPAHLQAFVKEKEDTIKQVETWENKFWDNQTQ